MPESIKRGRSYDSLYPEIGRVSFNKKKKKSDFKLCDSAMYWVEKLLKVVQTSKPGPLLWNSPYFCILWWTKIVLLQIPHSNQTSYETETPTVISEEQHNYILECSTNQLKK